MVLPQVNLKSRGDLMDIGEVSKLSKVPASALRFYEEKGLIQSIGRKGLKRVFGPDVIEKIALIKLGRNAGLSLDEISEMLLPRGLRINRQLLLSKADDLDKKISEMTAMREGLRHVAACKAPSHLECHTFLRLLNIADKKWGRPQNKKRT